MTERISPALHARLEDAASGPLRFHEPPRFYCGSSLECVAEPVDAKALGRVLSVLESHRTPAAILGAETRSWLGNPIRSTRVGVSTADLSGIDEFDEADGVVRVGAGMSLDKLAESTARRGWLVPIDSPGRGGTVGGALATGLCGPRQETNLS